VFMTGPVQYVSSRVTYYSRVVLLVLATATNSGAAGAGSFAFDRRPRWQRRLYLLLRRYNNVCGGLPRLGLLLLCSTSMVSRVGRPL
jgi:hypothetical protein